MRLPIYQVDAFSDAVFAGNPAAVCPLEHWLPDETLQSLAAENNLSETAFLVARDGAASDYELRWFTPGAEVDLCGHATLASAFVLFTRAGGSAPAALRFHTRSGVLTVVREGERLTMEFPARAPRRWDDGGAVAAALGVAPLEVWAADKALALLPDEAAVRAALPDMARVASLPKDGLIVTAAGCSHDFVSRYFAPHIGIPEDPVTGSAHCVLAPFWAARLGKSELLARQVSRRGGEVACRLAGDKVFLSGRASAYMEGVVTL
jgi:PhzF family phenazine biosynthesis protein